MAVSDNAKGALLMIGAMTAFTINDALMKSLAGGLPLAQAVFLRGLVTTALLLALAVARDDLRWPRGRADSGLLLIRTAMEVAAVFLFLTALFNMPIANATAILQSLPLTVTLFGALLLGERIGWRRLVAIAVGFLGVLLIVRPGTGGFTVYSLYALGAVMVVTIRDLAVRRMSGQLSTLTVALYSAVAVTLTAGLVTLFQPWSPVSARDGMILAAAAICLLLAYVFSVATMRVGEISAVAPFRYTGIVAALVLGVLVFGERPDALMLMGASLVVLTGLFTLWRERMAAGRHAAGATQKPVVDTDRDSL